ncbi:hypothetical protein E1193_21540 [Micromonospora sp. KC606]|uniref:hypothetical protein n=1 Tax=Micromonospora sp. KC606 TaxID=2530379 RepID=UPI00104D1245|nr:hypothetical protein [Micromonospora sp. KC606]TDC77939.1 hypothetical protein E1193_21540 [Micromonospora sp. KC606]
MPIRMVARVRLGTRRIRAPTSRMQYAAALSARVAWETARPMPDQAETIATYHRLFPGHPYEEVSTPTTLFGFYTQPLRWSSLDSILLGDGGEYAQNTSTGWSREAPAAPYAQALATVRRQLAEDGWRVGPTQTAPVTSLPGTRIDARRGDTVLELTLHEGASAESASLVIDLWRATPPAVTPAAVTGGLLGAIAGWLVFGWASRRTERPHPAAAPVQALAGVTLFLWSPALLVLPLMAAHHQQERHAQWHPFWEWLGQPVYSLFFLVGAVSAVVGLALALLPRRDVDPVPTPRRELTAHVTG